MALGGESRSAPRFQSGMKVDIQRVLPLTGARRPLGTGRIEDVSASGVRLTLDDPALRGERLRLAIPLAGEPSGSAEAELWVAWTRANPGVISGRYTCGAEYDPPSQPAAQRVLFHHRGHAAA